MYLLIFHSGVKSAGFPYDGFNLNFLARTTLLLLASLVLSGCASVFDAPYVEVEQTPVALSVPDVEIEPEAPAAEVTAEARTYPDIWARIREGFRLEGIDGDAEVQAVAKRFGANGIVQRIAERAGGLLYHVVDAVDARGLPMELVLVPFVESGYSLHAASHAEAHGAWQFIESTAKNYEIGIDRFRDDRRNLVVSTRAALDYLQALHAMFDDWQLAMAAYNCGERRVQNEIERARRRGVAKPGFKDIAAALPQETREYVPRILAVRRLLLDPVEYGVKLPAIPNAPQYSVVEIHRDIDVLLLARLAGLTQDELLRLNPSLKAPVIIGRHNVNLLLPPQAALRLVDNMATHVGPWVTWRMLRITRPATPQEIAERNRLSLSTVLQANPLPEGHYYEVGSTLLLPAGRQGGIDPAQAQRAVLLTRASSECMVLQTCAGDAAKVVPPATVNGLPRR
ncbi:lytic transglycosylase domain-containing protein [Azonexus hydrophilus]|uniref:lytic transglycosylase domain-containing protein n=1 Tax=Azonexus hydrophilus TaxID=418702 RepID=UPI0024901D2A|nr:lytic transglycosylase domain-containing protein [Azonexus hydrophilus]